MDPSQASQTEPFTCMSCDSYNAAMEGNIDFFKDITDHESLGLLRTPNKNTILHIYITALKSGSDSTTPNAGSESTIRPTINEGTESTATNFVKKILTICPSFLRQTNVKSETPLHIAAGLESAANFVEEILEMCPSLSLQANAKGETPLHIAARYGHDDIVEVLIKYCAKTLYDQDLEEGIEPVKEMLRMTNKQKDTALHEAVRYNHLGVVKLLISKDPNFSYSANDVDETPLYIAAERGFKDVLFEILDKCKSPMHGGPLGRTALYAAVMNRDRSGTIYLFSHFSTCMVNL
jgi:ankyrin repeat protein